MLPGLAGSAGQKFTLVLQMEKWKPVGRLGPCPRSQQGQARLPRETTRKPSDTALFLTVLATEMSSHRKRDPPAFGSCGCSDPAKHQAQDPGSDIHEDVSM